MKKWWSSSLALFVTCYSIASIPPVQKTVLDNGLTVLVRSVKNQQKVSVHLWYNVGSKDEKTGERGLAHLLEHMIFKGTEKLSETDIPLIVHKLSGSCNAFTYKDYTDYYFNVPVQHWEQVLPVLADCMNNCTFKPDLLNAEFKAVIQELKMNRDNYARALLEKMLADLFEDHPYHYPTIGFKQDIWSINSANLMAFYKKHYLPNNAVLVVVGNVDAAQVVEQAKKYFGGNAINPTYKKEAWYCNQDVATKSTTIYRDVHRPIAMVGYTIPGISQGKYHIADILCSVLSAGKSSRLHRELVDEKQLANWVSCFTLELFDHDVLLIEYEPCEECNIDHINDRVQQVLNVLATHGITEEETTRILNELAMEQGTLLESNYEQAYRIGKYFLATGDETKALPSIFQDKETLQEELKSLVATYCPAFRRHEGRILALSEQGKKEWLRLQQQSDAQDTQFLAARVRESEVEPEKFVQQVAAKQPVMHQVPEPHITMLANGAKVLSYARDEVSKIEIEIKLKTDNDYDSNQFPGLYTMLCHLMYEGTQGFPGATFAQELERRGIQLSITPGSVHMSLLKQELPKALELLPEVLNRCTFTEDAIQKIKALAASEYENFLDSPNDIAWQLMYEAVYPGHPYSKWHVADKKTIGAITREDIISFYQKVMSPDGARVALVGDITGDDAALVAQAIGTWSGKKVEELVYPPLQPVVPRAITYAMDRDQVVLRFAGLSVPRMSPDFDALALFEQVLGGGMHSRLFNLREKYGIFYRSYGSLTARAELEPGMVVIGATVSCDRLSQAEQLLANVIDTVADTITEQEIAQAKEVLLNSVSDYYATNNSIASTLLFLDYYGLPWDYFAQRIQRLSNISLEHVKAAVKKVLRRDTMAVLKVGRI